MGYLGKLIVAKGFKKRPKGTSGQKSNKLPNLVTLFLSLFLPIKVSF